MMPQTYRSVKFVLLAVMIAGGVALTGVSAMAQSRAVGAARSRADSAAWGKAEEVPGTAALNAGGHAWLNSVSCASAGDCSAGGYYRDSSGNTQAFVVNETNGTWGKAEEVPGTATLNAEGDAEVNSVSCASAGDCSAGGSYFNSSGQVEPFVVTETKGTWGTAEEVPGIGTLNAGGIASVYSLSCGSMGNCSAGGQYYDSSSHDQAFLVTETGGTWGKAEEVPGTAALNKGGFASVNSVSCGSAGDCSAGGYYNITTSQSEAFVVNETKGAWGEAKEVPGTAALNKGEQAKVNSVSCASAGDCSAGGQYYDGSHFQAFVASETNGTWGKAEEVPGTATLNKGGADINSVSCTSAGDCSAAGQYGNSSGQTEALVVTETSGTWSKAKEVPGTGTLNTGGFAIVDAVSCAGAGDCSAGGQYAQTSSRTTEAFVVTETGGTWGKAEEVPGVGTVNVGENANVNSVSCATATSCSAGGYYVDGASHYQAFVVNKS